MASLPARPFRSASDAAEQADRLLSVVAPDGLGLRLHHALQAAQLGHRVDVIVDPEVVVQARLGRGGEQRGGLLAALVAGDGEGAAGVDTVQLTQLALVVLGEQRPDRGSSA